MNNLKWLIWSNEHESYWAPNVIGYTELKSKAGRYSFEEALSILKFANSNLPDGEIPNETLIPDI